MILHLIRHGKTRANQEGLYCGKTDLPLTEEGLQAVKDLAAQGIYPSLEGLDVYSSGLERARQTLEAIYGPVEHKILPGFREMDFGLFEMKSYDQLKNNPTYLAWIEDETGQLACPGGESSADFIQRVNVSFEKLKSKKSSSLVVCHGGVIVRLMEQIFPQEGRHFYLWQPKPGEGYSILLPEEGGKSFSEISLLNKK